MENQEAPVIREDVKFVGTPEALGDLFAALAAAQAEFPAVVKDSTAKVAMKAGGSYTFDYAGLDVVIAATAPALTKHGLAMMQFPASDVLVTVLAKGSARIESYCALTQWSDAQAFGSAITYFKRYARLSILSVFPANEDDDGAAATGHKAVVTPRHSQTPPVASAKPASAVKASPDAAIPQTIAKVIALSKKVGHASKAELEAFSRKEGCGDLEGQTEANALRLVAALEGLQVQK